ncbi:MAG: type II toxin-antitoxin system RelE/ParE family toxin [Erysipelotrichaceae bacterium]
MQIVYKTKKLEKLCSSFELVQKKYSSAIAEKVMLRLDQLSAFETVEQLISSRLGRCHKLVGDRASQYALDLVGGYRLVFEKVENTLTVVEIVEIVDYH